MSIEIILFQALNTVKALGLPSGVPSSGTKFEDFMAKNLYQTLRQQPTLNVLHPRYTLREPTYSGVAHQFDLVTRESKLTTVECKFEDKISIAELFAYNGKLSDYCTVPRGIFLTIAQEINSEIWYYAIAHHILLVCPLLPPVEYMIRQAKKDSDLAYSLASLQTRLQGKYSPNQLFIEWQNLHRRFIREGYC